MIGRPGALRTAIVGSVAWALWFSIVGPGPVEALVALNPLVILPLVRRLTIDDVESPWTRAANWMQLPAALSLAAALSLPQGRLAAALAAPWLLVATLYGADAARRAVHRKFKPLDSLMIDAGWTLLIVGAASAQLSAAGLRPLDFSHTIVLLTAAHFHYAGLVLPAIAGLLARRISSRAYRWAPVGVLVGVPVTAAGITGSPMLELIGAFVVGVSGAAVAIAQLVVANRSASKVAGGLLALSSLSLLNAMLLAGVYAANEWRGDPWPSIPDMAYLHGASNALGFALAGVWGWILLERAEVK